MTTDLYHGRSWEIMKAWEPGKYQFDCLLTDPPYGVDFQSTYGKDEEAREAYQRKIEDDEDPEKAVKRFHRTLKATLPFLSETCEVYIFSQWQVAPVWQPYLEALGDYCDLHLRQLLIWEKGYPGIGDVKYNWGAGHEFIYYLKRGRRKMPYRRSGILHIDKVRPGTNVHPTQKPTDLLKILIEMSTDKGDWIFDPYAGSASTLVAAKECGRHAVGIERESDYYEVGMTRLSQDSLFDV